MTSAAIIMVAVFAIFGTLELIQMKQLGVGLGLAVLIDATVIRGVLAAGDDEAARRLELVPAAVARLGAAADAGGQEPAPPQRLATGH